METITQCHETASIILAYFHYNCKGHDYFSEPLKSVESNILSSLGTRERAFMEFLAAELQTTSKTQFLACIIQYKEDSRGIVDELFSVSLTHEYDQDFWLTGQLFDQHWKPRRTLDVALPQTLR